MEDCYRLTEVLGCKNVDMLEGFCDFRGVAKYAILFVSRLLDDLCGISSWIQRWRRSLKQCLLYFTCKNALLRYLATKLVV